LHRLATPTDAGDDALDVNDEDGGRDDDVA
jgi:hypothetical protein